MGLFWKIFVSFMVAITVTLVGTVYASLKSTNYAFEQVEPEGRAEIIEEMQQALNAGGRPGLERWLRTHLRPAQAPNSIVLVWEIKGDWWRRGRRGEPPQPPRDIIDRPMPWGLARYLNSQPGTGPQRSQGAPQARTLAFLTDPRTGTQYETLFMQAPVTLFGIWAAPNTLITALAIALLTGAATALGLALYLASPIVRLQRASRALAAGALHTRVGALVARRKDEVGTLARDFDSMAERLQALVTDKETLLRDVSHELRSPLARMRVALALAQRKVPEPAQGNLARIELEAERLDALVGQVMTLSRLRTATEPTKKPLQIDQIVSAVVDDARFEHPERVVNYLASPPIQYTGDADGLKSAVENVLRNALAYSPADKPIDVTLERTPSAIEIRIRDRGPGVDPQQLQRIFEPFYRTDESRDHRQDGQGIGLAITARVMELHGGSVEATNCNDGGLRVTLRLPLERPQTESERGRRRWRADEKQPNGPATAPRAERRS